MCKDDKSDLATACRLSCQAASFDLGSKEKVFSQLTEPNSELSAHERGALMAGFYSWDQVDELAPFYERFYDSLALMEDGHTYKYLSKYFYAMLPRMQITEQHIVKLMTLKTQVADTNSAWINILQDGIELLLRSKRIREFAN